METARANWELENNVELASEDDASLFRYDDMQQTAIQQQKPWARNPHFFKHVRVSALALIKMTMHCRSGSNLEVMGMLQAVRLHNIVSPNVVAADNPSSASDLREISFLTST